jgi:hypothetical protein
MSVIVSGIDRWDSRYQANVAEPRLIEALRQIIGHQLDALRHAPREVETNNYWDDWAWIGVPAYPFPRWLRCVRCKRLDRIDRGVFEIDVDPVRTHRSRFFHDCGGRKHDAQPVRVLAACPAGHLDDFPWEELVHADRPCTGTPLYELRDTPGGSRATDQKAVCLTCTQEFPVRQAFTQNAAVVMPACRGRHPHLEFFSPNGCGRQLVAQLVGASNAWFPAFKSALSLPTGDNPLDEAVGDLWTLLEAADTRTVVAVLMRTEDCRRLREWSEDEVWAAVEKRRNEVNQDDPTDLLLPEWRVLNNPNPPAVEEFAARHVGAPPKYKGIANVVAVDRLREVAAFFGFTRIASPDDADDTGALIANRAPISTQAPTWLPASETRGEGIFFVFPEAEVSRWEAQYKAAGRYEALRTAYRQWRVNRGLDPAIGMVPTRYVLLHTFSHMLITEIAVECGYNAASIRERLYARPQGHPSGPMAGVLLYTAAPDSEGTLGGLVALAQATELERLLDQAFDRAGLCTGDPQCSDHRPGEPSDSLHAAACYSCLFLPETSCERGNRFLDRAAVVATLTVGGIAYQWS